MAISLTTTLRNSRLDEITAAIGSSGLFRIYDGTVPASVGTALGAQVKLAELALSATFAPSASGGTLTASSITADSSADAAGTATFFRICTSGGTAVLQGTVGTTGADLNINTTTVEAGATFSVTSVVFTEGNA